MERALKTLERVISKAGLGSRTEARAWIHARRVTVNGVVIENPDHWVDFARDKITFDGEPLRTRRRLYVLLYKPTGYLSTYKDPEGRKTVYDLLTSLEGFVGTVGRLDEDSSGLLLLTNDNRLAERMTNPAYHVPKKYLVKTSRRLADAELETLRNGVALSDGPTKPARVDRLRDGESKTFLEITLTEGRNRQVRRMVEAVGAKVLKLVRTELGPLRIGSMASGTWRHLTENEVKELYAITGLSSAGLSSAGGRKPAGAATPHRRAPRRRPH
jgi:pseudouridine synthase